MMQPSNTMPLLELLEEVFTSSLSRAGLTVVPFVIIVYYPSTKAAFLMCFML